MCGQVGHPDGALIEQRDQDRQLRQGKVAGDDAAGVAAAQNGKQFGQRTVQTFRKLRHLGRGGFAVRHKSAV